MRALLVLVTILAMAAIPAAASQQKSATKSASTAAPTTPVNLNTATQSQLETLPGLGAKVAQRIIEYRQKNGNFKKVEEILKSARSGPCLLRNEWFARLAAVSQSR